MKVNKIIWIALSIPFICVTNAKAVQRVVLIEKIVGTWCPIAIEPERAMHRLSNEAKDTVAIVAYHVGTSDAFTTPETDARREYYNIPGHPVILYDGVIERVGSEDYNVYRADFDTRKAISSILTITLMGSYNGSTGQGTIQALIYNTSTSTISGKVHFVLTETDKEYSWQGEDSLFNIVRDMLPDANGEAVSISGGGSIIKSRNFTVSLGWNNDKCDIVVFVQGATKEIYQAAKIHITNLSIEEDYGERTTAYGLQIYPNPFSTKTVIEFSNVGIQYIEPLQIYDLTGRAMKSFPITNSQSPITKIVWDGKDDRGIKVPSGVYFCKFKAEKVSLTEKLIFAK